MPGHGFALLAAVLALTLAGTDYAARCDAQPPPKKDGAGAQRKIDLRTADPSKVDLSKVDPASLELSKDAIKQIDLNKWDLSKIDISKVKDPISAKWIQKVMKEKRELDKTLSKYAPGELERIQKDNLKWLRRPAPLAEAKPSREHVPPSDRIEQAARAVDDLLVAKLAEAGGTFNPPATDEQFVRRIYLDAAGRIPTADEVRAFASDRSPDKRRDLIDRLLLGPDYPSQMFNWLANMMRVRELKSNQGDNSSYQGWLIDQVAANRPWNRTVFDMLTAEGNLVTRPAVGWLVRDGGMPLDSLSNTLTTFMGANVACAQCHDHPTADYSQRNFYELAAFFGTTDVSGENVRGVSKVLKDHHHSATSVPNRYMTFPEDYKYSDAKPNSRVTPAFSTLKEAAPRLTGTTDRPLGRRDFAEWMTGTKNVQFAAAIANRLWGKAFGRAVMEPVTEMDDLDKADDPRLVKAIAALMRDLDFDLMAFQRVLYNTRAYQAQAGVAPDLGEPYYFPGPVLRRMTAEQAWDSFLTLVEGGRVNDTRRDRRTLAWSHDVFKPGVVAEMDHGDKGHRIEFSLLVSEAEKMSARLRDEASRTTDTAAKGRGGRRKAAAESGRSREPMARAAERPQPEGATHFLRQFGQSERDLADSGSTEGGVPQVLMLMNGDEHKLLAKSDSYVMARAQAIPTEAARVDHLYLSFLGRRPSTAERGFIKTDHIQPADLVWILMNTREFMFVQ